MQCLVGNEITLKRRHFILVERRCIRSAPHVPHIVQCKVLLLRTVLVKVRGTDQLVRFLQQLMSPIFFLADAHMLETSVFVQGYGSVVQQVTVAHQIHAAIRKQATHVFLQLLAIHKRSVYLVHQLPFLIGQAVRIGRVNGWEIGIAQLILFSFVHKHSPFKVYLMQQLPVLHAKLRTAVDDLRFQLELNNRNGLMHLRNQAQSLFIIIGIGKIHLRGKDGTRVIRISIHCKGGQR